MRLLLLLFQPLPSSSCGICPSKLPSLKHQPATHCQPKILTASSELAQYQIPAQDLLCCFEVEVSEYLLFCFSHFVSHFSRSNPSSPLKSQYFHTRRCFIFFLDINTIMKCIQSFSLNNFVAKIEQVLYLTPRFIRYYQSHSKSQSLIDQF